MNLQGNNVSTSYSQFAACRNSYRYPFRRKIFRLSFIRVRPFQKLHDSVPGGHGPE
jgi:hypothetical protein